jgi:hypothetical protein
MNGRLIGNTGAFLNGSSPEADAASKADHQEAAVSSGHMLTDQFGIQWIFNCALGK